MKKKVSAKKETLKSKTGRVKTGASSPVSPKRTAKKTAPVKTGKIKTAARVVTSRNIKKNPAAPAVLTGKHLEENGDLPEKYEESRLYIFPVDPYRIFSYWEINSGQIESIRQRLARKYKQLSAVIRFFDITGINFDGTNAVFFFDVPVDLAAGKWYIPLWSSGSTYVADIGLRNEFGILFPISRSNITATPQDRSGPAIHGSLSAGHAEDGLSDINDQCFMPGISSAPVLR
jgi:hypothetical protein